MAMGSREDEQAPLWVVTADLPKSPGHPFYARLNALLDAQDFDRFVEKKCRRFYAARMGRPSLTPGRYFRLLLLGYFEGIDSERGIAWRATDSLAIRSFLGLGVNEATPDHSTISRTRRLIDVETHRDVFTWVQQRLVEAQLLKGKTIAIDATTLEANAAMRSIVRRDTGETYQAFLTGLAKASGIETPTRDDLARLDRKRKKKTSNKDWTNPYDPDAKVAKMKDGRTHLAHKAEHAVDLETGAIVAVTLQGADQGDTTTIVDTATVAAEQIEEAQADVAEPQPLTEIIADKGYHSNQTMVDLDAVNIRTYIAEPDRGRRDWSKAPDAKASVYGNRRRIRGRRGRRLMRQRGERIERSFAHLYDTGGMRRTHLRGHTNILKRLLIHAGGFNLGLVMRHLIGIGTPRGLQGRVAAVIATLLVLIGTVRRRITAISASHRPFSAVHGWLTSLTTSPVNSSAATTYTTGCYATIPALHGIPANRIAPGADEGLPSSTHGTSEEPMRTTERSSPSRRTSTVGALWPLMLLFVWATGPGLVRAQWLDYPTPGIPRLADGSPDLKAPAPRTPDGRPDFSGMWFANVPARDYCREEDCIQEERMAREQINLGITLEGGLPYTEWSREQMKIRGANGGREDPHSYCMPPNFPRAWTLPQHTRLVQTPGMMVMLHEFNGAYREVYLDGRPLPVNPNPTWNGYSTGHWDGDTLVIETNGIRDDMWLDIQGSPVTESARVTERLTRPALGLMQVEIAVDDPRAYTRPWAVTIEMALQVDTQMLEEICMDNERDTALYK